jgi:predicted O-methyltransferase YrrM
MQRQKKLLYFWMDKRQLYYGYYLTNFYLPFSVLSSKWRRFVKRRKEKYSRQFTSLPEISWRKCTLPGTIRIVEKKKKNGNIRISELSILSQFAQNCEPRTSIFEIGAFDGRTTINLALNAPKSCVIYTLDLPPNTATKYPLESGEQHFVNKPDTVLRYTKYQDIYREEISRIHQLLGDSATFDYSEYNNSCSLVFVDGSHSYEYVKSDTKVALALAKKGGVIIWHDYGIWPGVTRALEEIDAENQFGLKKISGTSLVHCKKE